MSVPNPTPVFRLAHVESLGCCLQRGGIYAPNHTPNDGLTYRTIHDVGVQRSRRGARVSCGPGGVVHDYVPFYFGYLSPMLLQLKTGQVAGYTEGQEPLIYLMLTAQVVRDHGTAFVFSDGHGLAAYTKWFDDLANLDQVDWTIVHQRYWASNLTDMDRQRRKQAEFLVHRFCDWSLIRGIGVFNAAVKKRVEKLLQQFPSTLHRPVKVKRDWYY